PVSGPPSDARGRFDARGNIIPSQAGGLPPSLTGLGAFHFTGPVTCLDVQGGTVGLIYPIAKASGPVASHFKGQAIYITIQDNGPGATEHVGFAGPGPFGGAPSCPALVPFLSVTTGHIFVDGR
ncbi:MAG: hypothetical protein ACRDZY_05335, partial [Acidimicrobiales bacterium]